MGVDVSAYTHWEKQIQTYKRPLLKEPISIQKEEIILLVKWIKKHEEKFYYNSEKYILPYIGYNQDRDYDNKDLEKYIQNVKELKYYIDKIPENEIDKTLFSDLLQSISEDYAIAYCYKDNSKVYYKFNSLEAYQKEIWDYSNDIDLRYCNKEIPEAFDLIESHFNIPMRKYLIDITDTEYIKDEYVNHNVTEALELAKNILLSDEIEELIVQKRSDRNIYLKDVLMDCISVWEQNGKISLSY